MARKHHKDDAAGIQLKRERRLFPALRCRMGEWISYVTYLRFLDVQQWIKATDEVHQSKALSEWIQRRLDGERAEEIAAYLTNTPERFFNAIVVGVYGGKPEWAPLDVSPPSNADLTLSTDEEEQLETSVGILTLSGEEKLFAIDGQHRVAGIKRAVKINPDAGRDEVSAIFVAHEATPSGMQRTRRLFTTLNKSARKVSLADIVALDEDNGFAVVTRRLVDEFDLFKEAKRIALQSEGPLASTDNKNLTSLIGLYKVAADLYPAKSATLPKRAQFARSRPSDEQLAAVFALNCEFWTTLVDEIEEYGKIFRDSEHEPGEYRQKGKDHLLFRPVGQRAFAGAVSVLVSRGEPVKSAVKTLKTESLWLEDKQWFHLLWDPIQETMLTRNRNRQLAETHLLVRAGSQPRTKLMATRYAEFIKNRTAAAPRKPKAKPKKKAEVFSRKKPPKGRR